MSWDSYLKVYTYGVARLLVSFVMISIPRFLANPIFDCKFPMSNPITDAASSIRLFSAGAALDFTHDTIRPKKLVKNSAKLCTEKKCKEDLFPLKIRRTTYARLS